MRWEAQNRCVRLSSPWEWNFCALPEHNQTSQIVNVYEWQCHHFCGHASWTPPRHWGREGRSSSAIWPKDQSGSVLAEV